MICYNRVINKVSQRDVIASLSFSKGYTKYDISCHMVFYVNMFRMVLPINKPTYIVLDDK